MLKRIKAMWNRAWGPFDPGPKIEPIIYNMYPVVPKPDRRVIANGVEYEWWVTANTPWEWPEFFTLGRSPNYDIYRQVGYEEVIEGETEEATPTRENLFEEIFKDGSPMVEVFADAVHDVWADWMIYMFTRGEYLEDPKGWTMDGAAFRRWKRQMATPYADLPEEEKVSDRQIAKRYLRLALDG